MCRGARGLRGASGRSWQSLVMGGGRGRGKWRVVEWQFRSEGGREEVTNDLTYLRNLNAHFDPIFSPLHASTHRLVSSQGFTCRDFHVGIKFQSNFCCLFVENFATFRPTTQITQASANGVGRR